MLIAPGGELRRHDSSKCIAVGFAVVVLYECSCGQHTLAKPIVFAEGFSLN